MPATITGALGQSSPAAAVLTTAYTVPAGRRASVRVVCTNRGTASTFRVAVAPNGVGATASQYIAYDKAIADHDSLATVPMTLGSGDEVRVYSPTGLHSFTVTGYEQDE